MWCESEDKLLYSLHEELGNNWIKIAEGIPGRTASQCIQRWRRKFQPAKTRKNWTPDEDRKLMRLVHEYGNNWKKISSFFTKTGKQIRERFINKLDPMIKRAPFTGEEDELILRLYCQYGTKWNLISRNLPGRPQNAIKNRFYSHLKKQAPSFPPIKLEEVKTEEANAPDLEKLNDYDPLSRLITRAEVHEGSELTSFESLGHFFVAQKREHHEERTSRFLDDDTLLNKYIDFN